MNIKTWLRISLGAVAVEAALLLHWWISQDVVVVSQPSPDQSRFAQVVATKDFPYLSEQAYLLVRDGHDGQVRQKILLDARDDFREVVDEFPSLSWETNSILLKVAGSHYTGPKAISVP